MKIDFHYFTVKYIASSLGYREDEAQWIAAACQFINDNHQDAAIYLPRNQVSEAIKKRDLCQEDPSKGPNVCKIPLLLSALEDESRFDDLKNRKIQEQILIPYYYFSDSVVEDGDDYRVSPIKTLQSSDNFRLLFQRAADQYRTYEKAETLTPRALQALRRLGVLLHIASDSFAYEPFNGYLSDVNHWTIKEVKDTRTFNNITEQYDPQKYGAYPDVGKFRTDGVSDDYNVQFILTVDKSPVSYTRINNDCFAKAAKAVYGFLCNFRGEDPSDQNWRDNLLPMLTKGWNTDSHNYDDLKKHWNTLTGFNYEYDADAVRQSIVDIETHVEPDQQSYFDFLLMLQDVRDAVMGKLKEESLLLSNGSSTNAISCEVSDPSFAGDSYEITVTSSLTTKVDSLTMLVSIFDTDTQQQIATRPFTYKNIKNISEKVTLHIPVQNQNLLAQIDFSWLEEHDRKKSFKKEYKVIGNGSIVEKQEIKLPLSKSNRPTIQIVNGTESVSADYNYPLNAMYISQDGVALLDLYTPIELEWKLADGFNMLDYDNLKMSLILPKGQVFTYCNNSKYVSLKMDTITGIIHLKAAEEWKNRISVKDFNASIARMKLQIEVTLEVSSSKEDGYRSIMVNTDMDGSLVTEIELLWNL